MIDEIYQTVQARLNKEGFGYIQPLKYNLFINNAIRVVRNTYLTDLKSNVRKSNWMLDGKNLADFSEHKRQMLEYFSTDLPITSANGDFALPIDLESIENVYSQNTKIDKVDYSDFLLLKRNNYAIGNDCTPYCSKVGGIIRVTPATINNITINYLRSPKKAKWTYQSVNGKPMFNSTRADFQDVDMPIQSKDELISLVVEYASIYMRELQVTQLTNQEQQQDQKEEIKQ